jgi:putative transposase
MADFRTGQHVVHALNVHLVFTTKYRCGVITDRVREALWGFMAAVCADFEAELMAFDGTDDHVHLLVRYPPKVALSRLVGSLKGASAYRLRLLNLPEVRERLWGDHFWSPSYCAASCGGCNSGVVAPLEVVKWYIEEQRAEPRRKGEKRKRAALTSR